MKNARDIVQSLLPHIGPQHEEGSAFAPANIALVKYWGKRDEALNLPLTDSLSLSLKTHGTTTRIRIIEESQDRFFLNGARVPPESDFYRRTHEFLNLFRHQENFEMHTESNIPIAAGLASSASGFAALVLALDDLYGWQLPKEKLSVLARLGSGSACRSFWPHWVKWQKGERDDGLDSHGIALPYLWEDFGLAVIMLSTEKKPISSRRAMIACANTSALYTGWPLQVTQDMQEVEAALTTRDFARLGAAAERSSLGMHACLLGAKPAMTYTTPQTWEWIHRIWQWRQEGISVYFTQDAGPNLKLLFEESTWPTIQAKAQPFGLKIERLV